MTILDDLKSEAKELVRLEDNLAKMVGQHRRSAMNALGDATDREARQELINILMQTDFKGYFRDRSEFH
jgi:hypothetical protein